MTLRPLISRFFKSDPSGSTKTTPIVTPGMMTADMKSAAIAVPDSVAHATAENGSASGSTFAAEWRLIQTITFGDENDDAPFLGIGWGAGGDRSRWLTGSASEIWLEHPGPGAHFVLEFDLAAEQSEAARLSQRLSVTVRDIVLGRSVLKNRRMLRYYIPGEIVAAKGPIRIALQHEDAVPFIPVGGQKGRFKAPLRCFQMRLWQAPELPAMHQLEPGRGFAVADLVRLTGLQADNLVCLFESLGDNCEFGTAQRLCGAEPLGLLRFGAPRLPRLLECLRTRFEHFGTLENLEFLLGDPPRREYVIREKRYGMMYHTFQYQNEIDESQLLAKQAMRLKLLVRKLLEDLEDGEKVFVWKDTSGEFSNADALKLHAELAAFADNTLLWVTIADEEHRPGSVEWIGDGLLKGYVHRFSNPVPDVDLSPWLEICAKAYLLVQAEKNSLQGTARIPRAAANRPKVSPQPLLPAAAVAHGMAHVQNRGDVYTDADGWIGIPESRKAMEGFVILDDPAIPYAGLTYQVVLADGSLSEAASVSVFRGTRGKNQRLRGLMFTMAEDRAKSVRARFDVRFVDGVHLHDVAPGTLCQSESGAGLEAFRLTLEPIS